MTDSPEPIASIKTPLVANQPVGNRRIG